MRPVVSLRTLVLAASLVAGAAHAHTPFLLPNNFEVQPK